MFVLLFVLLSTEEEEEVADETELEAEEELANLTVLRRCIKLDANGPVDRWDGPARNDVRHLDASSHTCREEINE